jgi:hypothetical protein
MYFPGVALDAVKLEQSVRWFRSDRVSSRPMEGLVGNVDAIIEFVVDETEANFDDEIEAIRRGTIAAGSRTNYTNNSAKFLMWSCKRPALVGKPLPPFAPHPVFTVASAKAALLKPEKRRPPVCFENITAKHFVEFLVQQKKRDGTKLGMSGMSTHRSALYNMFRDFEVTMPRVLESELKTYFKGLKRRNAKDLAEGGGRVKVGKDPLDHSLYRWLCKQLLRSAKSEAIFSLTVLTLCWNLMARVGNGVGICWNSLEWFEDSLGVYFAHMKNDQEGERPRDARHVYGNPFQPETCFITILGIYMLCFPPRKGDKQVGGTHDI